MIGAKKLAGSFCASSTVMLFEATIICFLIFSTETPEMPKDISWHLRKEESLAILRYAEDPGTRILWLADKLTNMRSYHRLWEQEGDALWQRLNQSDPAEQAWYYRSVAEILSDLRDTAAWQEYSQLIDIVFGGVGNEQN